jgi:hypothetical protein
MNTHKITVGIATLACFATTFSLVVFAGCSSSSSPAPSGRDASANEDSSTKEDSGKGGKDGGKGGKDGGKGDKDVENGDDAGDGGDAEDAEDAADASEDTTTTCASDASTCNSCYDDAQAAKDPYNTCSPYTKFCVPFTTTVPKHPTL